MKLFRKLAAAALAGVMALSMLTGCALGDAAKENAMLKALQTVGNMYDSVDGVKVSEDKDLRRRLMACSLHLRPQRVMHGMQRSRMMRT